MTATATPAIHYARARQLASLLTSYDEKQSGKRSYNPYGLAIYFRALEAWEGDPQSPAAPVQTLSRYFTTNPADNTDFCLTPVRQFVREIKSGNI